tara:strand:+ start:1395 stop:3116 length:1722 start_codon:yes stop_codon:yes gene_type:complete
MITFLKNIIIIIFGIYVPNLYSQNIHDNISSLNDSIIKYKGFDFNKAIGFGFKALESNQGQSSLSFELVQTNYYIGEVYFYIGDYKSSFEYLNKSVKLYELLDPSQRRNKNVIKPPWVLLIMGNNFFERKDYYSAEKFFYEALDNFRLFNADYELEKFYGINTSLQNVSIVKREQGEIDLSRDLLDQVYERRLESGSQYEILATILLYMDLYFVSGEEDLFLKYYYEAVKNYESYLLGNQKNDEYLYVFAQVNIKYAEFLQNKNSNEESLKYLFFAKELVNENQYLIPVIDYNLSKVYIELGMNENAKNLILKNLSLKEINGSQKLNNFKLLEKIYINEKSIEDLLSVKDSIIFYNNPIYLKSQEEEFNTLENIILVSDKQNDLNISKQVNNRNILISIILLSSLSLIALSFRFNVSLQKEKNNTLKLEKDKIDIELQLKRRELFSKINFISQRNDYLNKIKNQIESEEKGSENIVKLKNEIKNITNSEKAYEEFDKMFSQVYPNFYKRLYALVKLSKTDIRLASYIKMNHTNSEIARISGISLRTVESQRYRLSKKLNISNGDNLNSFINNV